MWASWVAALVPAFLLTASCTAASAEVADTDPLEPGEEISTGGRPPLGQEMLLLQLYSRSTGQAQAQAGAEARALQQQVEGHEAEMWDEADGFECNNRKQEALGVDGMMFADEAAACRDACESFGSQCSAFDVKPLSPARILCVFRQGPVVLRRRPGVRCCFRQKFRLQVAANGVLPGGLLQQQQQQPPEEQQPPQQEPEKPQEAEEPPEPQEPQQMPEPQPPPESQMQQHLPLVEEPQPQEQQSQHQFQKDGLQEEEPHQTNR